MARIKRWYIKEEHNAKTKEVRYCLYQKTFFNLFKRYYRNFIQGGYDGILEGIVYYRSLEKAKQKKENLEKNNSWIK